MTIHEYVENEDGPDCYCGNPTAVKIVNGQPILLCMFHTGEAGMYSKLPNDPERPMTEDNWRELLANNAPDTDD